MSCKNIKIIFMSVKNHILNQFKEWYLWKLFNSVRVKLTKFSYVYSKTGVSLHIEQWINVLGIN